jgi:hypothetical protein
MSVAATCFFVAAFALSCGSPTVPDGATDPANAQFISSDLENFWRAYDIGDQNAYQREYLDRASAGLKDFITKRSLTAANLIAVVRAYPRYFASIRTTNLQLTTEGLVITRIRAAFAKIKTLYPAAVFPPVTFLIGRFSTGGTTASSGMLIGTEFYSMSPTSPTDELGQFQKDNVKQLDSLPFIVSHEHVHILQLRAGSVITHSNPTLLEQSLSEGIADFIGELASGGNINGRLRTYGIAHEHELFVEFKAAMHGTNVSNWLYNQGNATPDRPGDLGYFVGYRIAEAYYNKATNKTAAIAEIIEVRDADDFLARSGYEP